MTTDPEAAYLEGKRRAYIDMLHAISRNLAGDPAAKLAALIAEREEAIAKLREVCDKHGDNEWSDHLSLADIIENHLASHLESK